MLAYESRSGVFGAPSRQDDDIGTPCLLPEKWRADLVVTQAHVRVRHDVPQQRLGPLKYSLVERVQQHLGRRNIRQ